MVHIHTQIEIQCSPDEVRRVFLDFAAMPEWHKGLTITPLAPEKATPEPGDKLRNTFGSFTLIPTVLENNAQEFKWRGSFYGLLIGEHSFRFEPSTTTPGSTTFIQAEDFTGPLSFIARPGCSFGKDTKKNFETFNADIKARAESRQAAALPAATHAPA